MRRYSPGIPARAQGPMAPRNEHGAAMVELTLALPILLALVIGIINVSDILYTYSAIVAATRDGARLGVRNADNATIRALVITNTSQLRSKPLSSDITITNPTVSGKKAITVSACDKQKLLVTYPLLPIPNPLTLCASTTMRVFQS